MNSDYNKVSEIWFTQFVDTKIESILINSQSEYSSNFIIRLTEEAISRMESINDIYTILGPEYTVIRGLGLPGMFLVRQNTFETQNTLNYNKNIAFFEADEIIRFEEPIIVDGSNYGV
jgi:hypothetical protein